jgi:hypothetical protein
MTKYKEFKIRKLYRCVCGSLFEKRDDLVMHIKNKRKGMYKDKHYKDMVTLYYMNKIIEV